MKRKYTATVLFNNGDVIATKTLEYEYKENSLNEDALRKIDATHEELIIPFINKIVKEHSEIVVDHITVIKNVFNDDGYIIERNNTYYYKW